MKHIHSELMFRFAQDALESSEPWEYWEEYNKETKEWTHLSNVPEWNVDRYYRRVVREHEGVFRYPEPIKEPLNNGDVYYIPVLMHAIFDGNNVDRSLTLSYVWEGSEFDLLALRRGLVHSEEMNARSHALALVNGIEQ